LLLAALGIVPSLTTLLQAIWTSGFLGTFLPTTAGVDGVRAYSFGRFSGQPIQAVSSVVMDRVMGALSLALLAIPGALWSWQIWDRTNVSAVVSLPVTVVLFVVGLVWLPAFKRWGEWLFARFRWVPGFGLLWRTYESLFVYRQHPGVMLRALVVSLMIQFLRVLIVLASGYALGLTVGLVNCLVLIPAILLVSMLPISVGQWGVREGAFVYLFGLTGMAAGPALTLSLMSRAIALVADLPGVVLFVVRGISGLVGEKDNAVREAPLASAREGTGVA
jgi:uncharacterized membrane protein YbhN (UPF0104 family)